MVDLSDIFIGVINLILVLIPSVPYVVILVIFYRDKDSYGGSYEIMFHLGISDCLQLFCLTPSWATHFMDSTAFPFTLNKVFGALLAAGWINSVNFTLLLAINRLVLLFGGKRAEQFFEGIGLNVHWNPRRDLNILLQIDTQQSIGHIFERHTQCTRFFNINQHKSMVHSKRNHSTSEQV
ncbi:hypothetical protein Tcan_15794 [Toxocara canis]|uniref:Uncharacterized protein n=1 Tax=Toxocara canis TaxID=6265 RepID=A0A0B2V7W8_TOXCA|nr:hypothetical protein Tcan_15794 [Toxocara canis]